jgi:hypothetical protein
MKDALPRVAVTGALLSALFAAAGPTIVRAATAEHAVFATSDVDVNRPGGALEGTLVVDIGTDGGIFGYYRPVDTAELIDVHGSLTGKKIVLFVGFEEHEISGTYSGDKIDAYALEDDREHHFTATRTSSEQHG